MKNIILAMILVVSILATITISGCIVMDSSNELWCEANGGTWLPKYNECCPKGCPEIPSDSPALTERCGVCWLE